MAATTAKTTPDVVSGTGRGHRRHPWPGHWTERPVGSCSFPLSKLLLVPAAEAPAAERGGPLSRVLLLSLERIGSFLLLAILIRFLLPLEVSFLLLGRSSFLLRLSSTASSRNPPPPLCESPDCGWARAGSDRRAACAHHRWRFVPRRFLPWWRWRSRHPSPRRRGPLGTRFEGPRGAENPGCQSRGRRGRATPGAGAFSRASAGPTEHRKQKPNGYDDTAASGDPLLLVVVSMCLCVFVFVFSNAGGLLLLLCLPLCTWFSVN
mmetsp:Transcript_6002/g.13986  ORF Transcript_6002/g.13986 Transcript_6002/m.13986 type:complete len:264 (+) Transcript_6002:1356-2147(+)